MNIKYNIYVKYVI